MTFTDIMCVTDGFIIVAPRTDLKQNIPHISKCQIQLSDKCLTFFTLKERAMNKSFERDFLFFLLFEAIYETFINPEK